LVVVAGGEGVRDMIDDVRQELQIMEISRIKRRMHLSHSDHRNCNASPVTKLHSPIESWHSLRGR